MERIPEAPETDSGPGLVITPEVDVIAAPVLAKNLRRHPTRDGPVRQVDTHDGVGTDSNIVTDNDLAEDAGPRPKINTVTDDGHASLAPPASKANGYVLAKIAVGADTATSIQNDSAMMADIETGANFRRGRQADTSE